MNPTSYAFFLKIGYIMVFTTSLLVIIYSVLSTRKIKGKLGKGLKKITAGTILHTIFINTFFLLEAGYRGYLNDAQVSIYFILVGITGSIMLVMGYAQIYRLAKKIKLFHKK